MEYDEDPSLFGCPGNFWKSGGYAGQKSAEHENEQMRGSGKTSVKNPKVDFSWK